MKINYIVVFDDLIELYCRTKKSAQESIEDMVKLYACRSLSASEVRKETAIYKVTGVSAGK